VAASKASSRTTGPTVVLMRLNELSASVAYQGSDGNQLDSGAARLLKLA
jgi:hypothetical protein